MTAATDEFVFVMISIQRDVRGDGAIAHVENHAVDQPGIARVRGDREYSAAFHGLQSGKIIGGLLGMNLIDTPWMLTLPQVAFGVFFAMVIGLYFFLIKGWLR